MDEFEPTSDEEPEVNTTVTNTDGTLKLEEEYQEI